MNNVKLKEFVWDPTAGEATKPLMMKLTANGGMSLFYTYDANKNVSEMVYRTIENGIGAHYEYSPFGETVVSTRNTSLINTDICTENPFRFSSEYHDDEFGLIYYNYRHYNPEIGRWISRDPIEENGGNNLYCMCENDCINDIDFLGERTKFDDRLIKPLKDRTLPSIRRPTPSTPTKPYLPPTPNIKTPGIGTDIAIGGLGVATRSLAILIATNGCNDDIKNIEKNSERLFKNTSKKTIKCPIEYCCTININYLNKFWEGEIISSVAWGLPTGKCSSINLEGLFSSSNLFASKVFAEPGVLDRTRSSYTSKDMTANITRGCK